MHVSCGRGVHHADDGVPLALVQDPPRVDLSRELGGVVVAVEVEDADQLLAEGQAAYRVAVLVKGGRVDADPHAVGKHHHHGAGHGRLAGQTDLIEGKASNSKWYAIAQSMDR